GPRGALSRPVHRAQARRSRLGNRLRRAASQPLSGQPGSQGRRLHRARLRMSERHTISPNIGPATEPARPSAGTLLHLAREEAGLTLDAVAQQLKLAPRQVKAIEDDDFAGLPGRTFVRGFVRNYARL